MVRHPIGNAKGDAKGPGAGSHGLDRVGAQIHGDLVDLRRIGGDGRQIPVDVTHQIDAMGNAGFKQIERIPENLPHPDRLSPPGIRPREGKHLAHQFGGLLRRRHDGPQVVPGGTVLG